MKTPPPEYILRFADACAFSANSPITESPHGPFPVGVAQGSVYAYAAAVLPLLAFDMTKATLWEAQAWRRPMNNASVFDAFALEKRLRREPVSDE